ncbi:MAG: hypothetical protein ACJA2Q_002326 [Pseudohongiellaceae bacterium]|jgi:hypothetical protein
MPTQVQANSATTAQLVLRSAFIRNFVEKETLLAQPKRERACLRHRFTPEQRWLENQNLRRKFRYFLFIDVRLNQPEVTVKRH